MPDHNTAQVCAQRGRASHLFISRRKNRNLHFIHTLCGTGKHAHENVALCHITILM